MAKEGWISLHRPIQEHWIWKDANKFKWWVDILLTVNNTDAKVNIGNEFYDCKRGESLMSIQSWASRWNVSKDTARNFLKLLEKDNMIKCVSIGKSTRLTVCNYASYQQPLHVKQTTAVRSPYTNNNNNNEDNISSSIGTPVGVSKTLEEREKEFRAEIVKFAKTPKNPKGLYEPDMLKEFYDHWREPNKSKTKMLWETKPTWDLSLRLGRWSRNGFNTKKKYEEKLTELDASQF